MMDNQEFNTLKSWSSLFEQGKYKRLSKTKIDKIPGKKRQIHSGTIIQERYILLHFSSSMIRTDN